MMRRWILSSLVVAGLLGPATLASSEPEITPTALIESFNMRTLPLTVSSELTVRCETFPHELFTIWEYQREDRLLTLYDETSWRTYVDFLGGNTLGFSFRILDGFLHEFHEAEVVYQDGEWRAGPVLYPAPDHCDEK